MRFEHQVPVVGGERALEDPVALVRCIPGIESVEPAADGSLALTARVGMGPVRLRLQGKAEVRRPAPNSLVAEVTLHDRLAGSVYGTFALTAAPDSLALEAELTLGGRVGEFAQPLLRRKADETVRTFQQNLLKLMAKPAGA